jgi:hypothetical protein
MGWSSRARRETYLLVEDGLSLSTVSGLLAVVAALTLRGERVLALLVLCHLVRSSGISLHVKEQNINAQAYVCLRHALPLQTGSHMNQQKLRAPAARNIQVRRVLRSDESKTGVTQ